MQVNEQRANRENRPSPDALLQQAAKESRGRPKAFLGTAPGVGKTFEMLSTAQTKRQQGLDLMVGVVETHGRKETAALLEGLEIIARRRIDFKGPVLDEMYIDAILKRRPKLVLLDELAHTNAPDRRHSRAGDHVSLQLLDEGDGIPAENLEHIFDKFYCGHAGDHRRAGTGLGLAICRGFVEAICGTIAAANRLDRSGAIFTIELPIPAASPAEQGAAD
jgi:K+-sensing histidine kinase KdpD